MSKSVPIPDDGQWLSGPMRDTRPEFNPAYLVHAIERLLREHGITIDPAPGQINVAVSAAADLLTALGVRPVTAPQRQPRDVR